MDSNTGLLALVLFGTFLVLLGAGMWIPFALGIAGLALVYIDGGSMALGALGFVTWGSLNSFTLTAIPLFVLMGELILRGGLSEALFKGMSHWVTRLPGGLLHSNILGSATFAAVTGSSMTTALTMGTVSWPALEGRRYDLKIAVGSLAAGGTLGILIPPSIAMILYGTFTETSVAKLFMAGVIPGLVLTGLFMMYIFTIHVARPHRNPEVMASSWSERISSLPGTLPTLALIVGVLGGIYAGIFTPTEAAAVGAAAAMVIVAANRRLTWRVFKESVTSTVALTGMIMFTVLGGYVFSYGVETSGLAADLVSTVGAWNLGLVPLMLVLTLVYLVLGCMMDSIAIIVGATPVIFPLAVASGVDPIWFGIFTVILVELGQITPPMGVICFALQGVTKQPLGTIFRGVTPFIGCFAVLLVLIGTFPELVLWLPERL